MKRLFLGLTALSLSTAPGLAQATSYTSPTGLDTTEGNNYFYHWGGAAGRVLQAVDWSNQQPRAITQMAFRRDGGTASNTTSVSGTTTLIMVVSQCDYRNISTEYSENQTANVLTAYSGSINFPDWRTQPNPTPGKFDFVIKFSKTWTYIGRALTATPALCWTADYKSSTNGYAYMDRDYQGYVSATGTSLGAGCGLFGDALAFYTSGNYHPQSGMHLRVRATNAPAMAPIFVMLDGTLSNINVPGLCSKLKVAPTLIFYAGLTDASGTMPYRYLTLPFVSGLQTGTIYTQLLAVDPSQPGLPFAVSGGQQVTVPTRTTTLGHPACYQWSSNSGSTNSGGSVFFTGAPIVEFR